MSTSMASHVLPEASSRGRDCSHLGRGCCSRGRCSGDWTGALREERRRHTVLGLQ